MYNIQLAKLYGIRIKQFHYNQPDYFSTNYLLHSISHIASFIHCLLEIHALIVDIVFV